MGTECPYHGSKVKKLLYKVQTVALSKILQTFSSRLRRYAETKYYHQIDATETICGFILR